jgi:hypothetical protein
MICKKKFIASARIPTSDRPARSLVTVPTERLRLRSRAVDSESYGVNLYNFIN